MSDTFEICLPCFSGFYYSVHQELIDDELYRFFEIDYNRGGDYNVPDAVYHGPYALDYGAVYRTYAENYVEAVRQYLKDEAGIDIVLNYIDMSSPREYNFQTDRIFVATNKAGLAALYEIVESDGFITLERKIKERFTSRSGFISLYSNDIGDWQAKLVRSWDHNELGTLLDAAFSVKTGEDCLSDMTENYGFLDLYGLCEDARQAIEAHMSPVLFDFAHFQGESGMPLDFDAWLLSPEYAVYKAQCDANKKPPLDFEDWRQDGAPVRCTETIEMEGV